MQTAERVVELRGAVAHWRRQGETLALVPTMGNLHAGHMALIERASQLADRTLVSIFVNPMQFVAGEDYDSYPRTPEEDLRKLSEAKVDLLFRPACEELFPRGLERTTRVEVPALDGVLCGRFRPGHFTGVATVVTKLLNAAQPDVAVFGEKDYQQLLLVRRLVAELCLPVAIVAVPTVRDRDGLALSSRNSYLSAAERAKAPLLFETLKGAAAELERGKADVAAVERRGRQALEAEGFRVEYFEVRRAEDLMPPTASDPHLVVAAAAWLGRTRLIDHVQAHRGG